jgi:hypothetical protein
LEAKGRTPLLEPKFWNSSSGTYKKEKSDKGMKKIKRDEEKKKKQF